MKKKLHILYLFIASFFWGTTFVAQRMGADHVGAWTYLALRSWVAVVFLAPMIRIMDRISDRRGTDNRRPRSSADRKLLLTAGVLCGIMLCAASVTQQIGIAHTTASKGGFITALYVVIVPLLSILVRKRPSPQVWAGVVLALTGMYLLCMTSDRLQLEIGDAFVLACAFLFAVEIMVVDRYSPFVDAVRLSFLQFLVVAVLSTVFMLSVEHPGMEAIRSALPAVLYAGIFSSGIAYTLQIIGQDGVDPAIASLVMSFESVFSALSGWLVLHERLNGRELIGCALIFIAILLAQIEIPLKKRENGNTA